MDHLTEVENGLDDFSKKAREIATELKNKLLDANFLALMKIQVCFNYGTFALYQILFKIMHTKNKLRDLLLTSNFFCIGGCLELGKL